MSIVNVIIHYLAQLSSMILAWVWFGWKAFLIVFLISWTINTVKYT